MCESKSASRTFAMNKPHPKNRTIHSCLGWVTMVAGVLFVFHYTQLFEKGESSLLSRLGMNENILFDTARLPLREDWIRNGTPPGCKKMMQEPRRYSGCKKDENLMCADNTYDFFSSADQDYYLYNSHFARLKRRGVYLDVAANDPIVRSNTYFMDRCLGWKGLCVEGNPTYLEKLYRERSCAIIPTCVSDTDGRVVKFALNAGTGGIIGAGPGSNKNDVNWEEQKVPVVKSKCTTLGKAFSRTNIRQADYMSLDVEGHELQVLKGIDWDNVVIKVITIECGDEVAVAIIGKFMQDLGYILHTPDLDERSRKHNRLKDDFIFLHPSVVWGSPQ